jgi:ABC-2 type transport system permease protein
MKVELRGSPGQRPIPATVQLTAVAWLRWRMFVNSFRNRRASGRKVGSLILAILLRLILWPVFAVWVIGPVAGSGFIGWSAVRNHQPMWLLALLTGIAFLWQFIAVNGSNIAASMPTFDPSSLLRFPVPFGRYLLLRSLLGFLTPSTVIGCLALLAAAMGIAIADVRLAPMAFVALGLYGLMNVFFARMVGIWLERLLSGRRAREIFGGLLAIVVVSFQFVQLGRPKHTHSSWLFDAAMRWANATHWLPPGYAADAVLRRGDLPAQLGNLLLLALWAALFLAGFAYRLHKQYLGEYLSDAVDNSAPAARVPRRILRPSVAQPALLSAKAGRPAAIPTMLRKEWLTMRGNTGQLMGLLTPLIFVWIMSRGIFAAHSAYLLPSAVGYAILGPMAAVYNIFGPEGPGVQLYLIAPVRMRDVLLAKNLASLSLLCVEAAVAWMIAVKTSVAQVSLLSQIAALLWLVFVLAINLSLGTLRSIQAPRKFMPGQARKMRSAPTSRTSGLLVLAVVAGSLVLQVPVMRLSRHWHEPWLAVWVFGVLALAGVAGYVTMLKNVDGLVLRNRDVLEQELCGV